MITPIRALEKALVTDLLGAARTVDLTGLLSAEQITALDALPFYPGLSADTKSLPRAQVVAADIDPAAGFAPLPGYQEYVASLYIGFVHSAAGQSEPALDAYDALIASVQAIMEQPAAALIKTALNPPAEGADLRTVPELYIYDIHFESLAQEPLEDKNHWQVLLRYRAIFKILKS
jgi:hypothetical protein